MSTNSSETTELLGAAWGVIANVDLGNWDEQTAEWREAAERWRGDFHRHLAERRDPAAAVDALDGAS